MKNWLANCKSGDEIYFGPCQDPRTGREPVKGFVVAVKRDYAYVIVGRSLEDAERFKHLQVRVGLGNVIPSTDNSYDRARTVYKSEDDYKEAVNKAWLEKLISDTFRGYGSPLKSIPKEDLQEVCKLLKIEYTEKNDGK